MTSTTCNIPIRRESGAGLLNHSHREAWYVLHLCWLAGEHVLISGPRGCGKTTLARKFAQSLRVPTYYRIMTPACTWEELVGPVDAEIPQAGARWASHRYLVAAKCAVLDEISAVHPNLVAPLADLLDTRQVLVRPDGEARVPLRMTIGVCGCDKSVDLRLRDRFLVHLNLARPDAEQIFQWITGSPALERITSHTAISGVEVGDDVKSLLRELIVRVEQAAPGLVSPRKWVRAIHLVRAEAALRNSHRVRTQDLQVLRYMILPHLTGLDHYMHRVLNIFSDLGVPITKD